MDRREPYNKRADVSSLNSLMKDVVSVLSKTKTSLTSSLNEFYTNNDLDNPTANNLKVLKEILQKTDTTAGILHHYAHLKLTTKDLEDCLNLLAALEITDNVIDQPDSAGRTVLYKVVKENHSESCRLLLEHGANPNIKAKDGNSPLYEATLAENTELITLLVKWGADVEATDPNNTPLIHHFLVREFSHVKQAYDDGLEERKNLIAASKSLEDIKLPGVPISPEDGDRGILEQFLNFISPDNDLSEVENVKQLVAQDLLERLFSSDLPTRIVSKIISNPELQNFNFDNGLNLLGASIANGNLGLVRILHDKYSVLSTKGPDSYTLVNGEPVSASELTRITVEKLLKAVPAHTFKEACRYFNLTKSLYQLYLFLESLEELADSRPNQRGLSVYQVATTMLYLNPKDRPYSIHYAAINRSATLADRYLSESLLLLNPVPGTKLDKSDMPAHQLIFGHELTDTKRTQAHWALSRLGSLTHSFARFRFDSKTARFRDSDGTLHTVSDPLLVKFGGELIPDVRNDIKLGTRFGPQPYGTQFVFNPGRKSFKYEYYNSNSELETRNFDENTTISLRQGYYLVHNPNRGMLMVRNSSPEFGRLLLQDVYYHWNTGITETLSKEDILYPSPNLRALSHDISDLVADEDLIRNTNFLLDELYGFIKEYDKWKFDTSDSAWTTEVIPGTGTFVTTTKGEFIGGHKSQGFADFVEHTKWLYDFQKGLDEGQICLCFVHPDYPNFNQYQFQDNDGVSQRWLVMTNERIDALKRLAAGDCPEELLTELSIRQFFQQAGFDKKASLQITMT